MANIDSLALGMPQLGMQPTHNNEGSNSEPPFPVTVKWRDLREYLSYVDGDYPNLEQPLGQLVLTSLTTDDGLQSMAKNRSMLLANLNSSKPEHRQQDTDLLTVLQQCPGTYELANDARTFYFLSLTSALGRNALTFARSVVPDPIAAKPPRIMYAMATDLKSPLPLVAQQRGAKT